MSDGPPVRFAGYAAIFDAPDHGGDVIRRGAFAGASPTVPLLRQHRGPPVGEIESMSEDARGLRVIARVNDAETARLVAAGALDGLSIGFRPIETRGGAHRELMRLDLVEVSLVAQPMHRLARVHAVAGG